MDVVAYLTKNQTQLYTRRIRILTLFQLFSIGSFSSLEAWLEDDTTRERADDKTANLEVDSEDVDEATNHTKH